MFPMFLSSTSTAVTSQDFMSVITKLQEQISVSTVVEILVVVAGASVGLAFMWWGVRKVVGALMSAFRKGKVSL